MEELISVILNVYNGEKFISKCIDSIINQTYKNLEILIINDGSTDNTLNICKCYEKEDRRIRIITHENQGLSMSRNLGIDNSNGEYLYFVDSDDFVSEDVIEYLYNLCKKYETPIATCKPLDIYDYNFTVKNIPEKIDILSSEDMLKKILLSKDRAVTTWNKLIKKELFDNIRFEKRIINDMVVTHKLVISAQKIVYSNQIKYYFLKHQSSVTAKKNIKIDRYIDNYNASVERYDYLKNIYPNLIENDIFFISNTIMLYLDADDELEKFLNEKDAYNKIKRLYSLKVLFYPMKVSQKIRFILFFTNRKLCKALNEKYQSKQYKYKL